MNMASAKESSKPALYPRSFVSIVASVGGLALFLIVASSVLVSQPIGDTVRGYFYDVDSSRKMNSEPSLSQLVSESDGSVNSLEGGGKLNLKNSGDDQSKDKIESLDSRPTKSDNSKGETSNLKVVKEDVPKMNFSLSDSSSGGKAGDSKKMQMGENRTQDPSVSAIGSNRDSVVDSGCDLFHGKWVYDWAGPLYTNNSCPIITQMQNCQGNGRPDKDYENWRWKPSQCGIPRFDPKKFLEIMRGKTLAFIGDSVARNQMESMLCILWQVEEPKNRGNKKMQRYYFRSTSTMIVRIWSSWLVHQTPEPFDFAPSGVVKLHLDLPDETFMEHITSFDVIVLSSGHWFAKQSVYILNNKIVGGQLWWPDKSKQMKVNNIEAFGISVETILTSLGTHQNYTGLTIVRSFSPDHYEGGEWNTGGSCTGKVKPLEEGQLVENGFTNVMHEKQVTGFDRALKKQTNKSKLRLMDITEAFSYRHDGHPGPYRSPDPNKITKRGPDGRPPPQDCLHWCMPGPVDTWNELVFEIIKRELS